MMSNNEYLELYNHPKWQRKAAENKTRAGWRCQVCGADDRKLETHHGFYAYGRAPWAYPDEALFCLCTECHKRAGPQRKLIKHLSGYLHPRDYPSEIAHLKGLLKGRASGLPEFAESKARALRSVK